MGIRATAQHTEALVQPDNRNLRVTAQHTEALVIPDNRSMRATLQLVEALVIEGVAQRGPDTATATATTTTLTLVVPVVAIGDLLIAQVAYRNGTSRTITGVPEGWNLLRRDDNGTSVGQAIYTRVAAGNESGTSPQWTFGESGDAAGGITVYPAAAVDTSNAATATGTSINAPSVTSNGQRVVVLYVGGSSTGTGNQWTQPTDHAEGRDVGTASGIQVGKSDKGHAGGATGLQNATSTSNNAKVAAVLALRSAIGRRPRVTAVVV